MQDLEKELSKYMTELNKASKDSNINNAMYRAVKSYRNNVESAMEKYPHTIELANEVRSIKDFSVRNYKQLLAQAIKAIENNKGKGYYAKDREEVF